MKIDVSLIVKDHLGTLRDVRSGKPSKLDLVTFYVLPIIIALAAYLFKIRLSNDVFNVSITFFGIFIALLLNMQVAAFGIFQRIPTVSNDARIIEYQKETLEDRRQLLGEINTNISYLILIACIALVLFLVLFAVEWKGRLPAALTAFIYSHFMLTLLMVIKRSYALFQREYESPT